MMSDMLGMASAFSLDSSSAVDSAVEDEGSDSISTHHHISIVYVYSMTCIAIFWNVHGTAYSVHLYRKNRFLGDIGIISI